jgi:hypothetical protein
MHRTSRAALFPKSKPTQGLPGQVRLVPGKGRELKSGFSLHCGMLAWDVAKGQRRGCDLHVGGQTLLISPHLKNLCWALFL